MGEGRKCRHSRANTDILPGLSFQRRRFNSGISVSQTLSQRPGWRMAVVAEIANVIDGPALAFGSSALHLSSSGCPVSDRRAAILRASRFGMVEALATTALSAGLLLENGLACSNLLLAGSRRASLSNCASRRSDRGAAPPDPEYDSGSGCRRILRYVVRAAFDAGAAAGAIIFIGRVTVVQALSASAQGSTAKVCSA